MEWLTTPSFLSFRPYPNPYAVEWEMEIRVRPPVFIKSSRSFPWPVLIFDPVVAGKEELDRVFYPGLRMAAYLSFPRSEENIGGENLTTVRWAFNEIQRHLRGRMVPMAVRAASLFPADGALRWDVYRWSADDRTGRIAQLAETCPAALLRARALTPRGLALPEELQALFVSGVRLRKVVDILVAAWGRSLGPDALRYQAMRVLRAGHNVPLEVVWSPESGRGCTEDIPKDPDENAIWYLVFHEADRMADTLQEERLRTGYLAFVSRHALALHEIAEKRHPGRGMRGLQTMLEEVNDYLRCGRRYPGRATDPSKLLEECDQWHENQYYIDNDISPEQALDPGPTKGFPVWYTLRGKIRFIPTVKELRDESVKMHHCVASYARPALNGEIQLFHGDIDGEAVTIEITCKPGYPRLVQAKGIANREPGFRVRKVISNWLFDLKTFIARANPAKKVDGKNAADERN